MLRNSNDSLNTPSVSEEISTDDSLGHLNMSGHGKSRKSSQKEAPQHGCLPTGYMPQVKKKILVHSSANVN